MANKWTRPRWFIGVAGITGTDGEYGHTQKTVFKCNYMPTSETHELYYGYVMGPYKTRKEAEALI